jgi:hypothetical protein
MDYDPSYVAYLREVFQVPVKEEVGSGIEDRGVRERPAEA